MAGIVHNNLYGVHDYHAWQSVNIALCVGSLVVLIRGGHDD